MIRCVAVWKGHRMERRGYMSISRDRKGNPVPYYVNDYCVLDFETTGPFVNYARIVEVGMLKVRNGKVVDRYDELVHPGRGVWIPADATAIHHITNEMVANARPMYKVIDDITDFIGDDVIVGYNSAAYDMNLLYDTRMRLRNQPLTNDYIDVYHAVKRTLKDRLPDCKLETVCQYYRLPTDHNHRAVTDCSLTKVCYDRLYQEFGHRAFIPVSKSRKNRIVSVKEDIGAEGIQYE